MGKASKYLQTITASLLAIVMAGSGFAGLNDLEKFRGRHVFDEGIIDTFLWQTPTCRIWDGTHRVHDGTPYCDGHRHDDPKTGERQICGIADGSDWSAVIYCDQMPSPHTTLSTDD